MKKQDLAHERLLKIQEEKNVSNALLLTDILEALGEQFLCDDMIYQDELFDIQDKIGDLLVNYANKGNIIARRITRKWKHAFQTIE